MTTRTTRGHARLLLGALVATTLVAPAASAATIPDDVFISEYVESGNTKAIELFNGTGAEVDLSGWKLDVHYNGATTPSASFSDTLAGTIAAGGTFVLGTSRVAVRDQTHSNTWFGGDDAIVLLGADGAVVDSFGRVGEDPGSAWGTGDTTSEDNTLRRKASVCSGDVEPGDAFDPATEYDGMGVVTTAGLGTHAVACEDDTSVDTTPPTLSVTTDPSSIRGRNHKLVPVTVTLEATDDTDQDVDVELVDVASSDPDDGDGDGSTTGDIVVDSATSIRVRAERSRSTERIYTFTYRATDDAGNSTTSSATIVVG